VENVFSYIARKTRGLRISEFCDFLVEGKSGLNEGWKGVM